ncbi:methyltransferase [Candidatus Colwellia aromaticivorans]|uniref:methyltransferase n=1 Tax=Candidatus Colwellia aromaticivorans TaxID=2267621 RepID=UPI000DF4C215|nr:methyltransferase [Candidatus Colwellia aromaticivorans]
MSISNISQVLLRNIEVLSATTPLFINLMEDGFITRYLHDYPNANITCYNTNFIDYLAINNKYENQIKTLFSSEYKNEIKHDLVVINFPKSKDELAFTLAMIAPYLLNNAKIILVGEKKGGVQSAPKLTQHFLTSCQKIDAARHCLLFGGIHETKEGESDAFIIEDWYKNYEVNISGITLIIAALPGVFSQKKLDVGTALLLDNLPKYMQGKVLDFGCGAGVISCLIGKKFTNTDLSLLDVSALAIASAKRTLMLNGLTGNVFASDSLSNVNESYQHIVSNPPFHQGTQTSYQATEDFLRGIKKHLTATKQQKSDITIVANSFLQYLPIMQQHIGKTNTIARKQGFNIYYHKKG